MLKLGYDVSTMSPVFALAAVISYMEGYNAIIISMNLLASVVLIGILYKIFSISKNNMAPTPVRISSISPNDSYYAYMFAYGIPTLTLLLSGGAWIYAIVLFTTISTLYLSNSSIPNPILRLVGYHFYTIDLKDALHNYTLITKKKLANNNQVTSVYEVHEFLLIDKG